MSAPFMQLYVADYLGDTQHLTTEQNGAYLLLLMTMWRQGGKLPSDEKTLARIARVSSRRWHLICDPVMAFFNEEDGCITQKRLVEEYQKAVSKSEKRSVSGKAGGEAKALKDKDARLANAKVLPQHLSEPEPDKEATASSKQRAEALFAVEFAESFWPFWPNKVSKPSALKAFIKARRSHHLETIMSGTNRYVERKRPDQLWMNPSNFLNDERFNDQPAPQPNTGGKNDRSTAYRPDRASEFDAAFDDIEARRGSHRPSQPSHRPEWSATGIQDRDISFDRREDGSFGNDTGRPQLALVGGYR